MISFSRISRYSLCSVSCKKLQILFPGIVRHVGFLDHVDQGFAHVDRVDAIAGVVVRERVVQGLHDKARGDAGHALRAWLPSRSSCTSSFLVRPFSMTSSPL